MFGMKKRVVALAEGLKEFDIPLTTRVQGPYSKLPTELIYGQSSKRRGNKGN